MADTKSINTGHVILVTMVIALGSMNAGYQAGVINSMGETFQFLYNWSDVERDNCMNISSSILTVFATISALCGSLVIKPLGRRGMMYLCNGISILGCATMCFKSPTSLIVGRALMGIMMGFFFYLCPLFIRESVPAIHGGFYGCFHQFFITIGVGIAYALALILPSHDQLMLGTKSSWRQILCVPACISILQMLLFITVAKSDSPKALYQAGWTDQCKNTLRLIYNNEEDITNTINGYKEEQEKLQNISLGNLFSQTKNIIIICCLLAIFQQLSGINSLTYFSTSIFNEVLKSNRKATIATALLGGIQITFTFLSLFIIDRLGRKILLVVGSILIGIGLITFGYFYRPGEELTIVKEFICVGSIGFIFMAFALSQGPIVWTYLGEVMHQKTLPLAVASNLLFNVITVAWTIPLMKIMKQWLFYMYGMMMVACVVFCIIFVKETKGLSDNEIQRAYLGTSDAKKEEQIPLKDKEAVN